MLAKIWEKSVSATAVVPSFTVVPVIAAGPCRLFLPSSMPSACVSSTMDTYPTTGMAPIQSQCRSACTDSVLRSTLRWWWGEGSGLM